MGDVVNLRTARKARDRRARQAAADANRALHGRSKDERAAETAEKARLAVLLDGARRED